MKTGCIKLIGNKTSLFGLAKFAVPIQAQLGNMSHNHPSKVPLHYVVHDLPCIIREALESHKYPRYMLEVLFLGFGEKIQRLYEYTITILIPLDVIQYFYETTLLIWNV